MTCKIRTTKDYGLFRKNAENRPIHIDKHKKLVETMKKYGFLEYFPIVVIRDTDGNLIIKDGQHRHAIAEQLKLPVHFVEATVDFDIAEINSTSKVWGLRDYAEKFAENGKEAYRIGLEFVNTHGIQVGVAFSLLAGTTSFGNTSESFYAGTFKIKDLEWANQVASIYKQMVAMSPLIKNSRFLEACMACCRVPEFKPERLIRGAERCREKLVSLSTREAYLDMMESVYNFNARQLVGLKVQAMMVMKERNIVNKKKKEKMSRSAVAA